MSIHSVSSSNLPRFEKVFTPCSSERLETDSVKVGVCSPDIIHTPHPHVKGSYMGCHPLDQSSRIGQTRDAHPRCRHHDRDVWLSFGVHVPMPTPFLDCAIWPMRRPSRCFGKSIPRRTATDWYRSRSGSRLASWMSALRSPLLHSCCSSSSMHRCRNPRNYDSRHWQAQDSGM